MEKEKKISKQFNCYYISIVVGIMICVLGIIFVYLSIARTAIFVKDKTYGESKIVNLGYKINYGGDFYTEMSENTKYIASATKETYYLIERCFGISLIIIGTFDILHNFKQLKRRNL